jgi:hypothetical protein
MKAKKQILYEIIGISAILVMVALIVLFTRMPVFGAGEGNFKIKVISGEMVPITLLRFYLLL